MKKPAAATTSADLKQQLQLEQKERVQRGALAIQEILQKERLSFSVPRLNLNDGRLIPEIQIVAVD